jgi:hypothetical protein
MGQQDLPDLTRRLKAHKPASVLAIGPRADDLLAIYTSEQPDCRITCLDSDGALAADMLLEALSSHGRFDFVVVRGELERVDTDSGAHLLARLRDVHCRRFCVVIESNDLASRWKTSDLIAMGLAHWASETLGTTALEIYGFDLGTYKATPKWLNARHWANPEQWGKYRW